MTVSQVSAVRQGVPGGFPADGRKVSLIRIRTLTRASVPVEPRRGHRSATAPRNKAAIADAHPGRPAAPGIDLRNTLMHPGPLLADDLLASSLLPTSAVTSGRTS